MVLAPVVAELAAVVIDRLDQHAATPGLLLTMALSLILLFSWLAHAVGAPEIMGGFAAGFFIRKPRRNQIAIGLSMIPRGEVGLIFAQLGFSQDILNGELYAALLIVVALTTVSPPFLLKWFYSKK
jgi:Kef-type K+ transport system membrane component KefB